MKTLLIVLALAAPAAAQNIYYRNGIGHLRPPVDRRPIVVQQNVQRVYVQPRRLYQPGLYGYSYGPNMYGNYTSAFDPSPVFVQPLVVDPYGFNSFNSYGY